MSDKPRLYSYFRSSCSWRVRIALNLAGLEVEQVPIHLVKNGGEQHSQDYKKLNPLSQVPTLEMDGLLLTQSVAIMEYIHDTHPEAHILPEDPAMKAKVRMITEMICSGIQHIQNLSVMQSTARTSLKGWLGPSTGSLKGSPPPHILRNHHHISYATPTHPR